MGIHCANFIPIPNRAHAGVLRYAPVTKCYQGALNLHFG